MGRVPWGIVVTVSMVIWASAPSMAATVVPGTSNPRLAGMPDGTKAFCNRDCVGGLFDVAPNQSPVLLTSSVSGGDEFQFSGVEGGVSYGPSAHQGPDGPDGNRERTQASKSGGPEHGISDYIAPINALVGVFLGASRPDGTDAPARLDFSTAASMDFTSLSPLLKQIFFIGDGLTSSGVRQRFGAPTGAKRLYLGTVDGQGWYNNEGSFSVEYVVTPAARPSTTTLSPSLRSIEILDAETAGDGGKKVAIGQSFRVRLTYEEAAGADFTETVTVKTSGGVTESVKVKVKVEANATVAESAPILVRLISP